MKEIIVRLKNYETLIVNSLKIMHNKYVMLILHITINIVRDNTDRDFSIKLKCKIISEESFR